MPNAPDCIQCGRDNGEQDKTGMVPDPDKTVENSQYMCADNGSGDCLWLMMMGYLEKKHLNQNSDSGAREAF